MAGTLTDLFKAIANAIRDKTGDSAAIVANDFPTAIQAIPNGGRDPVIQALTVTQNGTTTAPSGVDGYSPIVVNVPTGPAIGIPVEYVFADVAGAESGTGVFLTGNEFVKAHRLETGFFALVIPAVMPGIKYIRFDYGGNYTFSKVSSEAKGITVSASSETNNLARLQTGAISGAPEGYNGCLLSDASGKLFCYTGGLQKVAAGKYHIIMGVLPL